ncbi:MAG: tetratricopeptide repeat protein [Verrucomicrobia bacterium]|nr:tetratricopeptide repeat protein [Verrucomicrobiota bacterium]
MLATKNWGSGAILFVAVCATAVFCGCNPPGTRAFLDGDRLLRDGKYEAAIAKLKVATELLAAPVQPRAWNHLGLAYHRAGRAAEAAAAYEQALRLHPNLAVARYNLGCLHLEQENLAGAIAELAAYTVLEPQVFPAWVKLGSAHLRSRQFDAAEKCYQNALQLNPALPEALNGLGLIQLQRKRLREALTYLNAALEKRPDYGPALLNLAIVYHQQPGSRQTALRKYREYLDLKPPPPNASAVLEIANQIEAELNPPPRLVQTNQPAAPPLLSQSAGHPTNVAAPRPSSTSAPPLLAASSLQTKPSAVKPPAQADQPTSLPKPAPERTTATEENPAPISPKPAEKIAPPPSPPEERPLPKIEVVTLTNEPPPKIAEDAESIPKAAVDTAPAGTPASVSATPSGAPPLAPLVSKVKPRNEGRTLLDRLNPRSWFRSVEPTAPKTPLSVRVEAARSALEASAKETVKLIPPPSPLDLPLPAEVPPARYSYRAPRVPVAGDRAKAKPLFAEGLRAHRERRLTAAIEAYREAVQLDPAFYEAHYNLGLAAYDVKDLAQSLAAYENAMAIDPESSAARYNFALALERASYFTDAANELKRVLADHPNDAKAHFALAKLCAERLSQVNSAREHYQRVLSLDPRHPEATAIRYWLAAHP